MQGHTEHPVDLSLCHFLNQVGFMPEAKCQRFDPKPKHVVFVPRCNVDVVHQGKRRGAEILQ